MRQHDRPKHDCRQIEDVPGSLICAACWRKDHSAAVISCGDSAGRGWQRADGGSVPCLIESCCAGAGTNGISDGRRKAVVSRSRPCRLAANSLRWSWRHAVQRGRFRASRPRRSRPRMADASSTTSAANRHEIDPQVMPGSGEIAIAAIPAASAARIASTRDAFPATLPTMRRNHVAGSLDRGDDCGNAARSRRIGCRFWSPSALSTGRSIPFNNDDFSACSLLADGMVDAIAGTGHLGRTSMPVSPVPAERPTRQTGHDLDAGSQ